MLQNNNRFHRHSLYSVMSHVVLFACVIKLNISTKNTVKRILPQRSYVGNLNALCNPIKKILDKILCRRRAIKGIVK